MSGYACLLLADKKAGYLPFNGWLFDPRVFFGKSSFISTEIDLRERILVQHRKYPIISPLFNEWKANFKAIDSTNEEELAKYSS